MKFKIVKQGKNDYRLRGKGRDSNHSLCDSTCSFVLSFNNRSSAQMRLDLLNSDRSKRWAIRNELNLKGGGDE